jgi:hypothetical protein
MPLDAQVVAARIACHVAALKVAAAKQFCAPTKPRVLPPSVPAPARRPRPLGNPLVRRGPGGDGPPSARPPL